MPGESGGKPPVPDAAKTIKNQNFFLIPHLGDTPGLSWAGPGQNPFFCVRNARNINNFLDYLSPIPQMGDAAPVGVKL
jgi:hypothetical protein